MGLLETIQTELKDIKMMIVNLQETQGDGIGKVMNKKQAADYLGISSGAIDQRMAKSAIPFVKNEQGHVRFAEYFLKRCELGEDAELLTQEMYKKFGIKRK